MPWPKGVPRGPRKPPESEVPPTNPEEVITDSPPAPDSKWWEEVPTESDPPAKAGVAAAPADLKSVSNLLAGAVAIAHDKGADVTGWEGWRLQESEKGWWAECFAFLLKDADLKNMPIVILVSMLVMSEGSRVAMYFKWRKDMGLSPLRKPRRVPAELKTPAPEVAA